MRLKLAGWIVELQLSQPALAELAERRYADFKAAAPGAPDLVVVARHEPPPQGHDGASILRAPVLAADEKYLLDGPYFYGMIEPSKGRASLDSRSPEPAQELEYFLRIALAFFALQRDGLLVHCATLRRNGLVHLFVGQSGSGKSTVVALSAAAKRASALGDDLILLRKNAGGWHAYGTPFWNLEATGRDDQVAEGPVAGIYKLVQDTVVFAEPMGRAAAAAELAANCPVVNDQPALLPALIDRCATIAAAIPVRRLHFRKDDAFWDVILDEAT